MTRMYRIEAFHDATLVNLLGEQPTVREPDDRATVTLAKVRGAVDDMKDAGATVILIFATEKVRGEFHDIGIMADGNGVPGKGWLWHRIDDISLENALYGKG